MTEPTRRPHPGPRPEVATSSGNNQDSTFLAAMARSLAVSRVVFVAGSGTARVLWPSGADEHDADADGLAQVGREWLRTWPAGAPSDHTLAVAPVRAEAGAEPPVVGVVLASKSAGATWTDAERDLLRFAASFYGPSLDDRAVRIIPAGRVLPPRPSATPATPAADGYAGDDLESGMRSAAGNGELYLVYQPEVDLLTGQIVAVEALLRWLHPQRGALEPDAFIALAEKSELITVLGAWVIAESTRQLASWNAEVPALDITLRVNVSPVQVTHDDIVSLFAQALAANGLPGERICVEITETVQPDDLEPLSRVLRALKELGITSAMDDVGTAYSTLSRLRFLPVDSIKIDRSLVSGIDTDPRAQAIVRALVGLANELGINIIAEGVEFDAEASTLIKLGCARAQGHFFGRPMSHASMLGLLTERGHVAPPGG